MKAPVVAVIYSEVTAPVVQALTPPLLAAIAKSRRAVDAAVFTTPRRFLALGAHTKALRRLGQATGRDPLRLTHFPRDLFLGWMGRRLASALARYKAEEAVLVCRQPRAAIVGAAARDVLRKRGHSPRVILDLRGLRDVEYLRTLGKDEADLTKDEAAQLAQHRAHEARACEVSDAVLCVSSPMLRIVRKRHGVEQERIRWIANHALAVENPERLRAQARADLKLAHDDLLFAYSGTMAAWQMPQESALLVRAFQQVRPGARLLVVTPDRAAAKSALKPVGLEGALIRSAAHADVPRLLCAADYGLLLRESSDVNRVACPVKFAEYLACGVRPVLSPGIGDVSDVTNDRDLGVVIAPASADATVRRLALDTERPGALDANGRAARRAWVEDNLSPARSAERLLDFVDSVTPRD